MKNRNSNSQTTSGWRLVKRAISATVFTTALAIIPATMLPGTAMADGYVEHFQAAQPLSVNHDNAEQREELTVAVLPASLVYRVENLLFKRNSQFASDTEDTHWDATVSDDWQVSVSMLKTGTLATPTRWAMLRYTRPIW